MKRSISQLLSSRVLALTILAAVSTQAATIILDFNTDPALTGLYTEPPGAVAAEWRSSGGASGGAADGYLSITDARDSQRGVLIFKDLENGLILKSFTFECDLRMGGGNDAPADGFSLNFASPDDPVVSGGAFAGTPPGEADLPEEGTQTGLAIGFDTWQSGTINGVQDVVGVSIRVDNNLIAQLPVPLAGTNIFLPTMPNPGGQGTLYTYDPVPYRNLATNNANYRYSMQTGARGDVNGDGVVDAADEIDQVPFGDPTWGLWVTNLVWEKFKAEVTDDGKVKVFWKTNEITPAGGLASGFTPRAGRLIFGARTGGNNCVHHVDNITLVTQPFTSVVLSALRGNAGGFTAELLDQATVTLDQSSVVTKLNGAAVTPAITKSGLISFVRYNGFPTLLPVGSTNSVEISFRDNLGFASTNSRTFVVPAYTTVPPEYAAAGVGTSGSGFSARVHQMSIGRAPGDANTIANAARQLANGFIDPANSQPYPNMVPNGSNPDGTYPVTLVNWNQYPASAPDGFGTDIGSFRATNAPPADVADDAIPGIAANTDQGDPTLTGYNDNIAVQTVAYLDLPAGFYSFGVESDDGFRVSTARGGADVLGLTLGFFNTGRGAGTPTFFDVSVPTAGIYPVRLMWWEGGGGANCEFFFVDQVTGQRILVNDRRDSARQIKAYPAQAATVTRPYVSRVRPEAGQNFVFANADVIVDITDGTIPVDNGSATLTLNGASAGTAAKNGNVTTFTRTGSLANLLLSGVNNLTLVYSFTDGNVVSVTNTWSFTVTPYKMIPVANKVTTGVDTGSPGFVARVHQIDRSLNTVAGDGDRHPGEGNRMPRPEVELTQGYISPVTGLPHPNLAQQGGNPDGSFAITDVLNFNSNPSGGNSGVFRGNAAPPYNAYFDAEMPGLPGTGTSVTGGILGIENYVAEFVTYLDLKAGAYVMAVNSDDGFVASSGLDPHDTLGTLLGFANLGRGNADPLPAPSTTAANTVPTPGTSGGNSAFGVIVPEDGIYPFRVLFWQGGGGVNLEFSSVDKGSGLQALINDTATPWAAKAYRSYTGPARPWVKFSVSPTPWDNRLQQAGPGPMRVYGRTTNSVDSGDIYNDSDSRRPWADGAIGGVVANGTGGPVGLLVNGTPVTPTLTTNGSDVTVSYRPSPPLPSGSANTASLVYGGVTNSWTFTVQTYTNLNASDAQSLTAGDPNSTGFRVKMTQLATTPANQNTVGRAEAQLAGTLGADVSLPGSGPNGTYIFPGIINWNNNRNPNRSGLEIGNFQDNSYGIGWPFPDYPDGPVPGVPGTGVANNYTDNLAAEIFAYLKFDAAGYYRFGVNSDDGFKLQVGTPGQTTGTVIASFDVGKGSSDIPVSFAVPQPGLYPIRLVYYNGGGGANLEYFSYDNTGNKIAINDTNNAASIKAFYNVTTAPQLQFTSATVTGGTLTINWTGTGTLQQAAALTGSQTDWSAVTPPPSGNSYSVSAAAAAQRFYRLTGP